MLFLGTLVNFLVVFIAGICGSFVKRGVNEKITDAIIKAMGVCVVFIGIDGALEASPPVAEGSFLSAGLVKLLVMILSIGLGTLIGEALDIDKQISRLGDFLASKLSKGNSGNFSNGFATCSILFCVGAMAVNGAFADAMGKPDILLAKSVIDGIVCFVMATTLGIGCAFSSFTLLLYQGAFAIIGYFVSGLVPQSIVTYMSVTGSLIILLIGTNMIEMTKIKTANMIPAIFLPVIIAPVFMLLA